MDKRKRVVRLYRDIEKYIKQESLPLSAKKFLLNKYYLASKKLRLSKNTIKDIDYSVFRQIKNRFSERIKNSFISTLSITHILTLPSENVVYFEDPFSIRNAKMLFLSDKITLPEKSETKSQLFFSFTKEIPESPFKSISFYPFSRKELISTSMQSTIFDAIKEEDFNIRVNPKFFDCIFFEAYLSSSPETDTTVLRNINTLLKDNGTLYLLTRSNFLSSNSNKKIKKELYSLFSISSVTVESKNFSILTLKKKDFPQESNISIINKKQDSSAVIPRKRLIANNLLNFREDITEERYNLIKKIEEQSTHLSGELFNFFLGMFRAPGKKLNIDSLRKNNHYKPLITSKDITPFEQPQNSNWILLEKDKFFTIPPQELFTGKKIVLRYLSVKPVFAIDRSGMYFLSDIAAIKPSSEELDIEYAVAYFNSKVIRFYYDHLFPHHTKFLKKNFNQIPFILPGKNIQKIIRECVSELGHMQTSLPIKKLENGKLTESIERKLEGYLYQLFKLNQEERKIIERYLS